MPRQVEVQDTYWGSASGRQRGWERRGQFRQQDPRSCGRPSRESWRRTGCAGPCGARLAGTSRHGPVGLQRGLPWAGRDFTPRPGASPAWAAQGRCDLAAWLFAARVGPTETRMRPSAGTVFSSMKQEYSGATDACTGRSCSLAWTHTSTLGRGSSKVPRVSLKGKLEAGATIAHPCCWS